MSVKTVYSCDICKEVIKDPRDSLGLYFMTQHDFTLGGNRSTDGTHICFLCAKQLSEQLANNTIASLLRAGKPKQ